MKKTGRWKEQVVSALEVPPDLAYRETIITLTGSMELLIENYKSISRYTPSEIVVLSLRGKVTICGESLEILVYFKGNEDKGKDFRCLSAEMCKLKQVNGIWKES